MFRVDWKGTAKSLWELVGVEGTVRLDQLLVEVYEYKRPNGTAGWRLYGKDCEFAPKTPPSFMETVWRVMWYQDGKTTTKKFFGENGANDAFRFYGDKRLELSLVRNNVRQTQLNLN
jgi:hypothetical protein